MTHSQGLMYSGPVSPKIICLWCSLLEGFYRCGFGIYHGGHRRITVRFGASHSTAVNVLLMRWLIVIIGPRFLACFGFILCLLWQRRVLLSIFVCALALVTLPPTCRRLPTGHFIISGIGMTRLWFAVTFKPRYYILCLVWCKGILNLNSSIVASELRLKCCNRRLECTWG